MNVIVSASVKDTFTQFMVVRSFVELKSSLSKIGGNIDTLIIHQFPESEFDAGVFISDLRNMGVKNFIYINSDASTTIRMVVSGVNGKYFEDEFYLDDEEELLALLEDIEVEESTEVAAPALSIINDFVQSFVKGEERISAPLYLERVNTAIGELENYTKQTELKIYEMGTSATQVFERASAIIRKMDDNSRIIKQQLKELEESQSNAPSHNSFGNNVLSFPTVRYTGNLKILVIRELSPCRYLTTFALGYLHHVHYELNKRAKLVFIHQKGAGVAKKYNDFTMITQESMNMSSLYDNEIIATNAPKKEVMRELWSRTAEVIICVDRLYGSMDIVSGRVNTVYAVSGSSDLNRFKVKPEDCIFSVTEYPNQMFCIPTIKNFPRDSDAKYASYSQIMEDGYKVLDKRIGI